MYHTRKLTAVIVVVVAGAFGWACAEQGDAGAAAMTGSPAPTGTAAPAESAALTGQDYGEIEALYARYSQGSDFRDLELFLSAFSEDAVVVSADGSSTQGIPAMRAARAERYQETGDTGRRHRTGSYLITPTDDGAHGRAYYVLLDVTTRPPTTVFTGYYDDEFVRTPAGWRIKHRAINRDVPR